MFRKKYQGCHELYEFMQEVLELVAVHVNFNEGQLTVALHTDARHPCTFTWGSCKHLLTGTVRLVIPWPWLAMVHRCFYDECKSGLAL